MSCALLISANLPGMTADAAQESPRIAGNPHASGEQRDQTSKLLTAGAKDLPGYQVWGHMVPHGLADYVQGVPAYGAGYPLDLIPGGYWDAPRDTSGVERAQQAGLTGMQLLQFDWENQGSDFVDSWMAQADRTWTNGDARGGFSVAPCWLLTTSGSATRMAREYISVARKHPSAAKVGNRFVIYVYAPRNLSPQQWSQERRSMAQAGLDVYLIGDLQTESSQNNYELNSALIEPWAPYFDAVWLFEDSTLRIWGHLEKYLASAHYAFAGGIMPGYNRETFDQGGYVDPQGTKQFRRQWQNHLDSGAPWANVVTWNDVIEHTDIKASSDWNITRQDINAFYASRLRRISQPKPSAQLYVTTPTHIRLGQSAKAEGLVLNGSAATVQVHTRLVDRNRRVVTPTYTATANPGSAVDSSIPAIDTINSYPVGRFLRAETWTTDANGDIIQRVFSAPIVIYSPTANPTPMMRQLYYSIPAAQALSSPVTLRIKGNPTTGNARAVAAAPTSNTRFLEVLQNTRQASLSFDTPRYTASIPMKPKVIVGNQTITSTANGFYVARAIDSEERVAYSDPVYVP